MHLRIEFQPRDCWIGAFWTTKRWARPPWVEHHLWICVLPMVPIHLWWEGA